jgi:hypothetical protein
MLKLGTSSRTLGGMCRGRLFGLIVLAGLAAVTGPAVPGALAQAVEPQSLVGVWEGTWVGASERLAQGTLNMTVTKVEGNQVQGRFERMGWANRQVRFDFVATSRRQARFRRTHERSGVDDFRDSDARNGARRYPHEYFDDKEQVISGGIAHLRKGCKRYNVTDERDLAAAAVAVGKRYEATAT